ncbi:MAG: hypothetical protein HPY57_12755 [Ignavibacteria bacterium]|nr:hypothetical protein [Ignavibacteria bacterium]
MITINIPANWTETEQILNQLTGVRLGIPTTVLAPKGWLFRVPSPTGSALDISNKEKFIERFRHKIEGKHTMTGKNASADATIRVIEDFTTADGKLNVTKEKVDKIVDELNSISKSKVKGVNIYSKSNDILGRRLTNPNWGAKDLMDVERPYKANQAKVTAPHLSPEEALRYDMNLMYKLQVKKFRRNPELIDEINERGGLQFILNSEHIVGVKGSRWEGKGLNSNFIKVLAASYTTVAKELNKFVESPQSNTITLKISGNDIQTLKNRGYTQEQINEFVYNLLKAIMSSPKLQVKIGLIIYDEGTGVDEAVTKAATRLGIPVTKEIKNKKLNMLEGG